MSSIVENLNFLYFLVYFTRCGQSSVKNLNQCSFIIEKSKLKKIFYSEANVKCDMRR